MKRLFFRVGYALLMLVILGVKSNAQFPRLSLHELERVTVANLGTCTVDGAQYQVSDGASSTDCSTGSGSTINTCRCRVGTGWEILASASGSAAEVNNLEADGAAGIADTEFPIGTGAGTVTYAPVSGDVVIANTGVATVQAGVITTANLADDHILETELDTLAELNTQIADATLEVEDHVADHAENAADELLVEAAGTACTVGQRFDSDGSGGVDCITETGFLNFTISSSAAAGTDQVACIRVHRLGTITGWDIKTQTAGSIVLKINSDTQANWPPTSADDIVASDPPTLVSDDIATGSATGWTTALVVDNEMCIEITSATITKDVFVRVEVTWL